MDTKLKSLNNAKKKVAQIFLILLCACTFVGSIHYGIFSVMTMDRNGFNLNLLVSDSYDQSDAAMESLSNYTYQLQNIMKNNLIVEQENPEEMNEIPGSEVREKNNPALQAKMQNFGKNLAEHSASYSDVYVYRISYAGQTFENWKGEMDTLKAGFSYQNGTLICSDYFHDEQFKKNLENGFAWLSSDLPDIDDGTLNFELGLTNEYLTELRTNFQKDKMLLEKQLIGFGACMLLTLISFILLLLLTGKKNEAGEYVTGGWDRLPTELFLIATAMPLMFGVALVMESTYSLSTDSIYTYQNEYFLPYASNRYEYGFYLIGLLLIALVGLSLILCIVRKIKAKEFLRNSFLYRLGKWLIDGIKEVYYGGTTTRKAALLIFVTCLISGTVVAMPIVAIVAIVFAAKVLKQYEAVKKGIQEVKNGNATYKIPIAGNAKGEFQELAKDINEISDGLDLAVKQELKNQRMKSELISNVSHDLKTPMTSIITYIDLLKREGIDSENAEKYLQILDEKSMRLNKLTENLFEAAKASSGDMPVHLTKIELFSLVKQGLGEYQDRLSEQGFQVIFNATNEKYYICADGQLLWRVIENLLGNILKYALENSRVYVDIRTEEDAVNGKKYVALDIKNISKFSLNIPEEELMERFKRGDDSRNSDGSGLGLAIARDLTSLQKGIFRIKIDGDLFKATVLFEESKEEVHEK